MRSGSTKLGAIAVGTACAAALLAYYLVGYLMVRPPAVAAASSGKARASLTLQTVASLGIGPHPDWVSYLVKDAQGHWRHSTVLDVPAHSLVRVTVLQYDTATGLRNPYFGGPRGIVGVMSIDGKPTPTLDPDLASHTFAIPDLGVSVPLKGVADDAKNQCSVAPCTLAEAHTTVVFTIRTGKAGTYRWQCFVPCAAGFILGFGGPMQSVGYMDGYLHVTAWNLPTETRKMLVVWAVLSAIAVPLIVLVLGPHLPPGKMSAEAKDQTSANTVLTALIAPIVILLLVYFGYALTVFRARGDELADGPPITGHGPTQIMWIVVTSAIVLGLAVWGSDTLIVSSHGAGGGQGPNPDALPANYKQALQVQVIGQQWNWTYRFPSYSGIETAHLELPADTDVELHVTSLDVVHSFWAYQLGVKADAVPGVDNIVFVNPRELGSFTIRCSELCGLWHGHMYQTGQVVSAHEFVSWIKKQKRAEEANLRFLPPYALHYFPEPLRRAG